MNPKVVRQNYPTPPDDASERDIVDEFFVYVDEEGKRVRALVGRIYCPKESVRPEDTLFDIMNPIAKYAKHKFRAQIRNRKRYDRDIKRRRVLVGFPEEPKGVD